MSLKHSLFLLFLVLGLHVQTQAQETIIYTEDYRLFKDAQEYYEQENYALAQKKYGEFLRIGTDTYVEELELMEVEADFKRTMCAYKLGHRDAEMMLVNFIVNHEHSRFHSRAYYYLGQKYFAEKNYKDLLIAYESVDPEELTEEEYADYYFQYAYAHFVNKKFDKAQKLFGQIINTKNEYFYDANYYYGIIAFFNDDYDTALASFKRSEKNNRYGRAIPYYISLIYHLQGKDNELLAYAEPKAKQSGVANQKEINHLVGQTYFNQQQFEKALPYLKYYVDNSNKVRKEDVYQLAFTQYKMGKYTDAIDNFTELNALTDSTGQNAMYHLADCYLKVGDKEKARNSFHLASGMFHDPVISEVAWFNYGKLSYELGFHSTAISVLQNFITKYPNSTYNLEARQLLTGIFETTQNYKDALDMLESMPNKTPDLLKAYQRVTYYRAVELFNEQNYAGAMAMFNKSLDNPYDRKVEALCHFWKADMHYRANKYDAAIGGMDAFISTSGGKALSKKASPATANYTIGYSLFKMQEYGEAVAYFNKTINALKGNPTLTDTNNPLSQVYPDAILRAGDCYFMTKQYTKAKENYDQIIQYNLRGSDYAYYQKGMLSGLLGDYDGKISNLRNLNLNFPDSFYADDALYQIALSHVIMENNAEAIETHLELIEKYPESAYVRKSLVNLGLIHFNMGKYDKSLDFYKLVLQKFPQSAEAKEALIGAKDVFVAKGDAAGYARFVRQFPGINLEEGAQDSIQFQIAENYYLGGDCDKAIPELTRYIKDYPIGNFALYAHFYRAQCYYSKKNYKEAGRDYDFIIDQPNNLFTEQALDKGARVAYFVDENYGKAFNLYQRLYNISSSKEVQLEALRGLMKSAYQTKKSNELDQYADLLRKHENVSADDKIDSYYFPGVLAYQSGNLNKAKTNFEQTAALTTNEKGAMSRYYIAEILYSKGDLTKAKDACFRVINETSAHEYWVVKSYILLGDVFTAKGDMVQAKATFKSIIDNYGKEDELMKEARAKLKKLEEKEALNSRVIRGAGNSGTLDLDNQ